MTREQFIALVKSEQEALRGFLLALCCGKRDDADAHYAVAPFLGVEGIYAAIVGSRCAFTLYLCNGFANINRGEIHSLTFFLGHEAQRRLLGFVSGLCRDLRRQDE